MRNRLFCFTGEDPILVEGRIIWMQVELSYESVELFEKASPCRVSNDRLMQFVDGLLKLS